MTTHPTVLFDGVCNLCNGLVTFLIEHDPEARLRFAPLQTARAKDPSQKRWGPSPLRDLNVDPENMETIVFVEPSTHPNWPPRVTVRSDAALRVARYLPRPWRWARFLRVIPRPIRDAAYNVVAKNRYRWFGRREVCRVPTPEIAERFIDW